MRGVVLDDLGKPVAIGGPELDRRLRGAIERGGAAAFGALHEEAEDRFGADVLWRSRARGEAGVLGVHTRLRDRREWEWEPTHPNVLLAPPRPATEGDLPRACVEALGPRTHGTRAASEAHARWRGHVLGGEERRCA